MTGKGPTPTAAVSAPAVTAAPAAVACHGLTKRFGGAHGVLAVDGLDLDVPAGSVFGLLGPNGAGKTTTLRLVTGLARPTGGSVDDRRPPGRPRMGRRPGAGSASSTRTRATTAG